MYGFSLLVIPILAYYLPAIISAIRWWKNLEAGIYKNTNPPPPYVITETKYKTNSGKFIDSDGVARDSILSKTQGAGAKPAAKQMSDNWIIPRLADALIKDPKNIKVSELEKIEDIETSKYERWLMIVDGSGEVINITKLDAAAKSIEEVIL